MEEVVISEPDDFESVEEDPADDVLDLPPPTHVLSVGERFCDFLVDTSVIYRYGITRLATSQVSSSLLVLHGATIYRHRHSNGIIHFWWSRCIKCVTQELCCMLSI